MKKIFSLLTCAALLIGSVQPLTLAAETEQKSGAKFGLEKGDVVSYAGKDGAPIKWKVLDAEKSNAGDINGAFLLSNNTFKKLDDNSMEYSLNRLKPTYTEFYNEYFADSHKKAVMETTVTDTKFPIFIERYSNYRYFNGALDSNTVFALSAQEANTLLTAAERKGSFSWLLRSVYKGTGDMAIVMPIVYDEDAFSYVKNNNGEIQGKPTYNGNLSDYYFRPAVNLDKTKLAGLDGVPLLLPTGDNDKSGNILAPVGNAAEWRLSLNNENVTTSSMYTSIDSYNITLSVNANLETINDNDCISVIIVKKDGSISHYGRFNKNNFTVDKNNIRIVFPIPSDTDMDNDTMYAFYENYNGGMSASISSLTKVCLKHSYYYESISDLKHYVKCRNCSYTSDANHELVKSTDDETHTSQCKLCNYVSTVNHSFETLESDEDGHTVKCSVCDHEITGKHIYGKTVSQSASSFWCSLCNRQTSFKANNIGKIELTHNKIMRYFKFDGDSLYLRDVYKSGSVKYENCTYSSDQSGNSDGFFSEGNYSLSNIPGSGKPTVTFSMQAPIKAIGFTITLSGTSKNTVPSSITLYGKNSSSDGDYTKIGHAVIKSILPQQDTYDDCKYGFVFDDNGQLAVYDDYKLEMSNDPGETEIKLKQFSLISDEPITVGFYPYPSRGYMVDAISAIMDMNYKTFPGEDLTFTLRSKRGHPLKSEISIKIDGENLADDQWSYSEETGILTVDGKNITKGSRSIDVTANCSDSAINVKYTLNRLYAQTFPISINPKFGDSFYCRFYNENPYESEENIPKSLDDGDIKVLCGGNDITSKCTYLPSRDNKLTVPGEFVTGDLEIIASARFLTEKPTSIIKVEKPNEPIRWYDSVTDAMTTISSGGNMTVTLVGNQPSGLIRLGDNESLLFENGTVTFDLNNKILYSSNGIPFKLGENAVVTAKNGTCQSATGTYCEVGYSSVLKLENVKIFGYNYGIKVNSGGTLIVNNTDESKRRVVLIDVQSKGSFELKNGIVGKLIIADSGKVALCNGTVELIGGSGTGGSWNIDYKSLLGEGCEYSYIESEEDLKAGKFTKVSVKCNHTNINDKTGLCENDGVRSAVIKAKCGSELKFFNYFYDAVSYSNEHENTTITLLDNVAYEGANPIFYGKNVTLDLNGKTLENSGQNYAILSQGGNLTITGNGVLKAELNTQDDGSITIENGKFEDSVGGNLILKGGQFVMIYGKEKSNKASVFYHLADGKTYKFTNNGDFVTKSGVIDGYPYSYLYNVEVVNVPITLIEQPKSKVVAYGSDMGTLTAKAETTARGDEEEITYEWLETRRHTGSDDWHLPSTAASISNSSTLTLPTDFANGEQRMYQCIISYNGYTIETDSVTVTYGKKAPQVKLGDVDYKNVDLYLSANGNDCVLVAAAYCDDKLLDMKTQSIKAEDGLFYSNNILGLDKTGAKCIKIFVWDSLETQAPLTEPLSEYITLFQAYLDDTSFIVGSVYDECTVYIASYNGDKLIDVKPVTLNESTKFEAFDGYAVYSTYEALGLNTEGKTNVKVFFWDDLKTMKPLKFDLDDLQSTNQEE